MISGAKSSKGTDDEQLLGNATWFSTGDFIDEEIA